jgi:BMFP domain-containing protein YqiC
MHDDGRHVSLPGLAGDTMESRTLKTASATIERILEQLSVLAPIGSGAAREEVKALLNASFASMLGRMNLVSREEFDAQSALLARARERLETLEARLAQLERAEGERAER